MGRAAKRRSGRDAVRKSLPRDSPTQEVTIDGLTPMERAAKRRSERADPPRNSEKGTSSVDELRSYKRTLAHIKSTIVVASSDDPNTLNAADRALKGRRHNVPPSRAHYRDKFRSGDLWPSRNETDDAIISTVKERVVAPTSRAHDQHGSESGDISASGNENEDQVQRTPAEATPGAFSIAQGVLEMRTALMLPQPPETEEVQRKSMESSEFFVDDRIHAATLAPRKPSVVCDPVIIDADVENGNSDNHRSTRKRKLCILGTIGASLAIVVVIVLSVVLFTRKNDSDVKVIAPASPTPAPTRRSFNASRLPALVARLEGENLPFPLNSTASQFALGFITNTDGAFLDVDHVDMPRLLERFAASAFYSATNGFAWPDQCQFLSELDVCEWKCNQAESLGVHCDNGDGRVTSLVLPSNNLEGSLPDELLGLSSIEKISLDRNQLSGGINILEHFMKLRSVFLDFNRRLSGPVPAGIGLLTDLEFLSIGECSFTGTVPSELGDLTKLKELHVYFSRITGEIPSELGRITSLISLELSGQSLEGSIPSELGNLSNLKFLFLNNNRLTGTVPNELASLSNLSTLSIHANNLEGDLDVLFCTDQFSWTLFETDCISKDLVCSCCTKCH